MNNVTDEREAFAAFLLRQRGKGGGSKELVAAFEATPRRDFIPAPYQSAAWSERTAPIECGEAIEGVDLQAHVISALELGSGHRVLEVGTGSGFTAAVMARLAGRVITLERYKTLAEQARQRFEKLGLTNAVVRHVDGAYGLPAEGPFDRIVAWAAFDGLPRPFIDQLSTGGIMITPIGPPEGEQVLAKLTKVGSRFERVDIATVRLQPIAKGVAAKL